MICTATRNFNGFEYTEEIHKIPFTDSIFLTRDNCHIFYGIIPGTKDSVVSFGSGEPIPACTYKTVVTVDGSEGQAWIGVDRFTLHPIHLGMTLTTLTIYEYIQDSFDFRHRLKLYNEKHDTNFTAPEREPRIADTSYVVVGMIDKETVKVLYQNVDKLMINYIATNTDPGPAHPNRVDESIINILGYNHGGIGCMFIHYPKVPDLHWSKVPEYKPTERLELDKFGLPRISGSFLEEKCYNPITDPDLYALFKEMCYISREMELLCGKDIPEEIIYSDLLNNITSFLMLCDIVLKENGVTKCFAPRLVWGQIPTPTEALGYLYKYKAAVQRTIKEKYTKESNKGTGMFTELVGYLVNE